MTVTTIGAAVVRSGNMKKDVHTVRGWKLVASGEQWHEYGIVREVNGAGRVRVAWYLMVTPHGRRAKKVRTWVKSSALRIGSPAPVESHAGGSEPVEFMTRPASPAPRLF